MQNENKPYLNNASISIFDNSFDNLCITALKSKNFNINRFIYASLKYGVIYGYEENRAKKIFPFSVGILGRHLGPAILPSISVKIKKKHNIECLLLGDAAILIAYSYIYKR